MKLAMDVGNTHTVLGNIENGAIEQRVRTETRPGMTGDELRLQWDSFFDFSSLDDLTLVVASVVPEITRELRELNRTTELRVFFLEPPWKETPISVNTDRPERVGADRIAGATAFHREFGGGIIVDFGTATTLDLISEDGCYRGGVIFPGIEASASGLAEQAALLPQITTDPPETLSFQDTQSGLRSGLFYGTAGAVDRLLDELIQESDLRADSPVVATGGGAEAMSRLVGRISDVRTDLVIEGLRMITSSLEG